MRTLASGRGCEGVGQGLLVDLGGEHGPCPVLLVSYPHNAVWEGIRGGVIQLLQQVLQVCGQKRFGNGLPIFGRSSVVTFRGCWLGLGLPLLLKHEVNAAELLRAVNLIEKLPIHSQVILGTVEIVFESTNHFGTDSVVRGGLPRGDLPLLELKLCRLYLLPMFLLQVHRIHPHVKELIGIAQDTLSLASMSPLGRSILTALERGDLR